MKILVIFSILVALLLQASATNVIYKPENSKVVRVLIIGGFETSKLWSEITKKFEEKFDYKIEVVDANVITSLAPLFREGKADLITMHSDDITTHLVSDGHGINMRPWARNDHVIIGPKDDPAGIRGLSSGVEALKKIASTKSNWIPYKGDHLSRNMWRIAKINPNGDWVLKDDIKGGKKILSQVAKKDAYMITGRMPIVLGKWERNPNIEILVDKDDTMKRPYIVMEANPKRHPNVNFEGAKALSNFLLSKEIQEFLLTYDGNVGDGIPLYYPVWPTLSIQ